MTNKYFLLCEICGSIVGSFKDVGEKMECCGQEMKCIAPNMVDAEKERHLPVAKLVANRLSIKVRSDPSHDCRASHSMDCHHIRTDDPSEHF